MGKSGEELAGHTGPRHIHPLIPLLYAVSSRSGGKKINCMVLAPCHFKLSMQQCYTSVGRKTGKVVQERSYIMQSYVIVIRTTYLFKLIGGLFQELFFCPHIAPRANSPEKRFIYIMIHESWCQISHPKHKLLINNLLSDAIRLILFCWIHQLI